MPLRLLVITILLTILSTVTIFSQLNNAVTFINLKNQKPLVYIFTSITFFISAMIVWVYTPTQGLVLQFQNEKQETVHSAVFQNTFDLNPSNIPESIKQNSPNTIMISGILQTHEPINAMLLYTSHGSAVWKLDGESLVSLNHESNTRSLFRYVDIQAGVHQLSCELSDFKLIPRIAARTSTGTNEEMVILPGPFIQNLESGGFQFLEVKRVLFTFFLSLGLFLLIPVLNTWLIPLFSIYQSFSGLILNSLWVIVIFIIVYMKWILLTDPTYLQIESDESAFGLMSLLLKEGQSPPLFHYGQNYQGTFESIILSLFQSLNLSPAQSLKALPTVWFFLFLLITSLTFWRFGSKQVALFSCMIFLFMGIHFHWLFHKAWFGYSFSLVCGSIMWYAALSVSKFGIKPYYTLLWGMVAGLSLYELPIAFPFVVSTFLLILYSVWQKSNFENKTFFNYVIPIFFHKSMIVLYGTTLVFLSPYLLSIPLENKSDSISFLFEGRTLSAPRETDEHPFFDRFLEECLQVLTGVRQPYDQQNNPFEVPFPSLPSVLIIIGLITSLFLRLYLKNIGIIYQCFSTHFFIVFFIVFTILIGCISPFGIWPWYFSALYWGVPLILYPLFTIGFNKTPGLTFIVSCLLLFTQIQSFKLLDEKAFQPLSITASGLDLPSEMQSMQDILRKHDVKFVISDQGYDYSAGNSGRDWIGETLSYQSDLQVISIDTHSRRLPDKAQLLANSNRVGYLFHEDFLYQNPIAGDENYSAITIEKLERLFGEDFLNYQQYSISPYVLFVPQNSPTKPSKNLLKVETSWHYFEEPILDHNISSRSASSIGYWSSDKIPPDGATVRFTFEQEKTLDRIVLFHGPKANDYPLKSVVTGFTPDEREIELGSMIYDPTALASKLDNEYTNKFKSVEIRVFPNEDGYWLTIYEAWIW